MVFLSSLKAVVCYEGGRHSTGLVPHRGVLALAHTQRQGTGTAAAEPPGPSSWAACEEQPMARACSSHTVTRAGA